MVSPETHALIQNIFGIIFLANQLIGLLLMRISRIVGKKAEQGKFKNITKSKKASEILFYTSSILIGISFLLFLFLFINKNVWDFLH